MAALALTVLLILSLTAHSSANWCVCKQGPDQYLQKTLDYACGNGADCSPIKEGGPCYEPNTMKDHCSYAVNSYFQKKSSSGATCDFSQTAQLSSTDPSSPGCSYPSSGSTGNTGSTGKGSGNGTPSLTTPSTTGSGTTSPFGSTPTGTGVLGGLGNGLGPSGDGMNNDFSDGGLKLLATNMVSFSIRLLVPAFMLLWQ